MPRKSKHAPAAKAPVVTLAEARATRTLADIRERLGGDADAEASQLAACVASQLASLPAEAKRLLRREVAIAVHELEDLVEALESELDQVADDLHAINRRASAAQAYGHAAPSRAPRRP